MWLKKTCVIAGLFLYLHFHEVNFGLARRTSIIARFSFLITFVIEQHIIFVKC